MGFTDPPPGVTCVDVNGDPISVGDRVRLIKPPTREEFIVDAIEFLGYLDAPRNALYCDADAFCLVRDDSVANGGAVPACYCEKVPDEQSDCESRCTDDTPCPYCHYSDADYGCQCELERQGNGPD